jgi:NTP pyrophosphatase (non-canonical NTP hydrolase)
MNLSQYQSEALQTAVYPLERALDYTVLGLASEAGEVAGKLKKIIRDGEGNLDDIADELGDVLWYCAAVADALGTNLEIVAARNLNKLSSRKARGVLGGSGDKR